MGAQDNHAALVEKLLLGEPRLNPAIFLLGGGMLTIAGVAVSALVHLRLQRARWARAAPVRLGRAAGRPGRKAMVCHSGRAGRGVGPVAANSPAGLQDCQPCS